MKCENGFWIDGNNNRWDTAIFTEKQAVLFSNSLTNCRNCSYCSDCSDCNGCSYCRNCSDCSGCSGCRNCRNCSYCSYCSDCSDCSDCNGCRNCNDCSDCNGCTNYKSNPLRIMSKKIGSRKSQTTVYCGDAGIQVICGCFRGNLIEFEQAVNDTHKNNPGYLSEYKEFIEIVKKYQEYSCIK